MSPMIGKVHVATQFRAINLHTINIGVASYTTDRNPARRRNHHILDEVAVVIVEYAAAKP